MKNYGRLDLLLHRLALGSVTMRRIAFDVDCLFSDAEPGANGTHAPVYIASLARSGTTILLEILYASGAFATLTYRGMPFVTAPNLWSRIACGARRAAHAHERAHGDRLKIGFDSPEAFEEPFWTMLSEGRFIGASALEVHSIGDDGLADYGRYVRSVLAASKRPHARYLAKNSNNLLRLKSLRRAFPDACILVPFRRPWDHARSLLRQHLRFSAVHARDRAALSYMNWLGHFEFGANFKPFNVDPAARPRARDEVNTQAYWLRYWTCVYRYLLSEHEDHVVFLDYDRLCREPVRTLESLAAALALEPARLSGLAAHVHGPSADPREAWTGTGAADAAEVYAALRKTSLQAS